MIINEQDERIRELSTDEYFYLTENLEYADSASVRSAVSYLVINKRRRLHRVVRTAVENELSETERELALDFWDAGLSAAELVKKHGIPRSTVYRRLDSARKKLERSLKYVLMYDGEVLRGSSRELMSFVKKENAIEH